MPLLQSLFIYKTKISELSFVRGCIDLQHLFIMYKVLVEIGIKFTLWYCSNLRKIGLCVIDKLQRL
jgi:hypothetical protein